MKASGSAKWLCYPEWVIAIFLVAAAWPGSAQTRFAAERVIKILNDDRPRGLWVEDIDLDGDIDVLHTTYGSDADDRGTVAWLPNLGDGRFGASIVIDSDILGAECITTADVNGDGLNDLVVTSRVLNLVVVYDNLGSGSFGPRRIVDSDARVASYAKAADLDGDEDLDLVAAKESNQPLVWYENDGFGQFLQQHVISDSINKNRFVWTEDLDGDGYIDVLAATTGSNGQIYLYYNNGDGSFSDGTQLTSASGSSHKWIRTEDLDGDGDPEILSTCYTTGAVFVFENLGGRTFGPLTVLSTNNDGARFVWTGDLDEDGDQDILAASEYATRFSWIENRGGMMFSRENVISIKTEGPNEIYPADLDGDGDLDLVAICAYPDEDSRIIWFEQLNPDDPGAIQFNEFYFALEDPALFHSGPNGLLLMVERNGLTLSLTEKFTNNAVLTYQDLRSVVQRSSGGAGLVDMVLDPDYATNGYFYVAYETAAGQLRLARFGQAGLPVNSTLIGSTEVTLLEVPITGVERNMALAFGPDGYLYVAIGDGWQATMETQVAADLGDWRGKVLRLEVGGTIPYTIPADNPYVGVAGALPEIWLSGVHQVLGLHFDRETGDFWLVDRGELLWDEVHRFPAGTGAGANLGWPGWEGMDSLRSGPVGTLLRFPEAVVPAQDLIGGMVYRGNQVPMFHGSYLAFSEESGVIYSFQDMEEGLTQTNFVYTHRPGLVNLALDNRSELVATDAGERKFLYLLQSCSSATPPGKLYADAYRDGRVNMRFEPVPGAYQYEITVRKPDNALMYRSFVVTNLERVTDVPTGRTYIWRVRAQCNDETITPYSAPDTILMPAAFTWESRPEKIQGADQVKVSYPNASLAMISPSDPTGVSELMVFDLLGHMVFVQNHIQHWPVEVNYSSWPAGLYVVRINALEKRLTGRMVVQR